VLHGRGDGEGEERERGLGDARRDGHPRAQRTKPRRDRAAERERPAPSLTEEQIPHPARFLLAVGENVSSARSGRRNG
jgi:hypothetical protein